MPCTLAEIHLRFRKTCCLNFRVEKKKMSFFERSTNLYQTVQHHILNNDTLPIWHSEDRILNTVYIAIGICHASYIDCMLVRSGS